MAVSQCLVSSTKSDDTDTLLDLLCVFNVFVASPEHRLNTLVVLQVLDHGHSQWFEEKIDANEQTLRKDKYTHFTLN